MIVCIAEKPSVGKDIARVLGATKAMDGYMEGNGYQVTWTLGHLCELKEPHDYHEDWKVWNMLQLPMVPEKFGIKVKDDGGVRKQMKIVTSLFKKADRIVNCGDAGQEGELIQRWVQLHVGVRCPVDRLWISSLTDEAIREGFRHLRPQKEYDPLFFAGQCRAVGDWLLGMNCTRLYTLKYGRGQLLSIGRVQTPTLALVCQRDEEIRTFVPTPYWVLATIYRDTLFTAQQGRYDSEQDCRRDFALIAGKEFRVTNVTRKEGQEAPKQLFDLTQLQVECNRRFGFTADQTLNTMQSLYEKKVATYPRVDTQYLSDDIYPECAGILRSLKEYGTYTGRILAKPLKKSKRVFDSSKVTDHHAIIPTGKSAQLTTAEQKMYDLICRRFIAVFMDDCRYATTTVLGEAGGIEFKATGKEILSPGWRALYGREVDDDGNENGKGDEKEKALPSFTIGEHGAHKPDVQGKETLPPKRYTEASLLQAMETAGKFVEDEELRRLMKENGIGRPSSRAGIIETLFHRGYIVREKKSVVSTQIGRDLMGVIRSELLKSCELTGIWEKKLRDIEHGMFMPLTFMEELKAQIRQLVDDVKSDSSGKVIYGSRDDRIGERKGKKSSGTGARTAASRGAGSRKAGTKASKSGAAAGKGRGAASIKVGDRCPLCGQGTVRKGPYGLFCDRYKEGCKFRG